jgi:hypothetical protein
VEEITSRGLRSTRTIARHRVVSDGGTSIASEPGFLLKTHLTLTGSAYYYPSPLSIRASQSHDKRAGPLAELFRLPFGGVLSFCPACLVSLFLCAECVLPKQYLLFSYPSSCVDNPFIFI